MKKRLIILIIGMVILGFGINSLAETEQESVWELGVEISLITYKEPGVMKETGEMYGLLGSYTYHESNFMGDIDYIKMEGRLSFGWVDYEGARWDGTPLSMSSIPDAIWEFRALAGIELGPSNTSTITPTITPILYGGVAYRYLNDDSSFHSGGYERESYYTYIPIGMTVDISSDETPTWITFEYDYFLGGTQISYLSDADSGLNNIENEQDDGYGFRCSIKTRDEKNTVTEYFVRYWNIKDSNLAIMTYDGSPIGYGLEPKNNSIEIGINAVWRF